MDRERLFDIAVEENIVPDDYFLEWDTCAEWQISALRELGLTPASYLLDIGCGALRLGSRAIPFLDPGHYCGIDSYEPLLRTGRRLMTELGIEKPFATLLSSDLNFEEFNLKFDYAIAQSVFTSMSQAQIHQCVHNLLPVMETGGVLLFTYTLLPADARRGLLYFGTTPMSAPMIVSEDFLRGLAAQEEVRYQSAQHLEHPTELSGLFRFS